MVFLIEIPPFAFRANVTNQKSFTTGYVRDSYTKNRRFFLFLRFWSTKIKFCDGFQCNDQLGVRPSSLVVHLQMSHVYQSLMLRW